MSVLRRLLAGLALSAVACARAPEWTWTTPPVVGEEALVEALRPRGDERLVLANFWASW